MALPRPSKKALPALGALLVAGGFSPQIQSTTARMSPSIRGELGFSQSRALKAPSRLIGSIEMTRRPMAMRAGVSMGASSDEGSRVTVGPR